MRLPLRPVLVITALAALSGCGDEPKAPEPQAAPAADTGRPETRKILAADAVGFDGRALRKSVDTMLDKRDEQNKALEAELKKAEEP